MTENSFEPTRRGPPTFPKQIRINTDDWAKVEKIAKSLGEAPSEIIRQALHFALEHMPSEGADD